MTHIPNRTSRWSDLTDVTLINQRGLGKRAGIDDSEIIKKVLKHLNVWDVKRYPAPGALQHISIRGIERKAVFSNDTERMNIDRFP